MANKALIGFVALTFGACALGRVAAEFLETRDITKNSVHIVEFDGIFSNRVQYDWYQGYDATFSYNECNSFEYGRLAVIAPRQKCKLVSIGAESICSDRITGVCIDNKCRASDEMTPEQLEANQRKYKQLCDIVNCEEICEEWKNL